MSNKCSLSFFDLIIAQETSNKIIERDYQHVKTAAAQGIYRLREHGVSS